MTRPLKALTMPQQQEQASREVRRLRWQVRRLETQNGSGVMKQYRRAPNLEGVDPEIYGA